MIPNNVNDLVQAVRDGEVGVIDQIKIGELVVSSLFGLDMPETLSLTRRKIQTGSDMAIMAIDDIDVINMNVCLANPDISIDGALTAALTGDIGVLTETWRDKKNLLKKIKEDREIVDVQTQDEIKPSFLIVGLYPIFDVDENWDAFICTVVLEKARIYGSEKNENNLLTQGLEAVSGL